MLRVRDAHSHTHTHTCGNTKTQKSTNVTLQTRPCRYGCYSFSPCWSEAATATATSHHSMTSADPSLSEQEVLSPPKRLQKHEAVAFFLWGGIGHVTSPPPSARPSVRPSVLLQCTGNNGPRCAADSSTGPAHWLLLLLLSGKHSEQRKLHRKEVLLFSLSCRKRERDCVATHVVGRTKLGGNPAKIERV